MPTVEDVRKRLNDISSQRVSDDVISVALQDAQTEIEPLASTSARTEDVEMAVMLCAAYWSYLGYAMEVERAAGGMPPAIETNLRRLYQRYMYFRARIQGATADASPGHVFAVLGLQKSLYDDLSRDPTGIGRTTVA